MTKSIITDDMVHCYICGRYADAIHHCFYGNGRRSVSDREGLTVPLCNECHNFSDNSVHFNKNIDLLLKRRCQQIYEQTHSREEFLRLIGHNYLDDENDND